jgi:hypothetical protein
VLKAAPSASAVDAAKFNAAMNAIGRVCGAAARPPAGGAPGHPVPSTTDMIGTPSVALFGGTALVDGTFGTVDVYQRAGASWRHAGALTVPAGSRAVAHSLALAGNLAVIGDKGTNGAFVFARTSRGWELEASLSALPAVKMGSNFGWSVAADDNLVAVGAYGAGGAGRVYVFSRTGSHWRQSSVLTPPVGSYRFGWSVALSGTTLVVGSKNGPGGGRADIYDEVSGRWRLVDALAASPDVPGSSFGESVAIDRRIIVVGGGVLGYAVFQLTPAGWRPWPALAGPRPQSTGASSSLVGLSVAVGGARTSLLLAVSAPEIETGRGASGTAWPGHVYTYSLGATRARVAPQTLPGRAGLLGGFGQDIAMSGNTLLVGAAGPTPRGYIYTYAASGWRLEQTLTG